MGSPFFIRAGSLDKDSLEVYRLFKHEQASHLHENAQGIHGHTVHRYGSRYFDRLLVE
jgi:hypothetical protein